MADAVPQAFGFWWTVVLAASLGCGEPTQSTPPWAPVAGISSVPLGDQTVPYAEVLGRSRAELEAGLLAGRPARDPGWVRYGEDLLIEYDEDDTAQRLRIRTPQAFGCHEAARWMGFPLPRQAVLHGSRCVWPGARLNRRLAKGYGGEYDLDTRWFRIWLVPPTPSLS